MCQLRSKAMSFGAVLEALQAILNAEMHMPFLQQQEQNISRLARHIEIVAGVLNT